MLPYRLSNVDVTCFKVSKDEIPSFYRKSATLMIERVQLHREFHVICESRHVTGYTLNDPPSLDRSPIMEFVQDLEDNLAIPLMGRVPNQFLNMLTEIESLYVLDFKYGMSIGVRRLLEDFVIENYGTQLEKSGECFGKKFTNEELKGLKTMNAKYILAIFSPLASKDENITNHEKYKKYLKKKEKLYPSQAKRLEDSLLASTTFDKLFNLYKSVSDYIHGNSGELSQSVMKDGLILVMQSCKDYIEKGFGWGVQ